MGAAGLTGADEAFAARLVRRRKLFLGLAVAGVVVGLGLAVLYGCWYALGRPFAIGPRAVIVVLVLLNARQNLRQYRASRVVGHLMGEAGTSS